MQHSLKLSRGVTLLEVMLVLSIVAMIILMSVRYYQATSSANQVQQGLAVIQAITAAADNIAMGNASGYNSATSANLNATQGGITTLPWGGKATIAPASTSTYAVTIPFTGGKTCNNVSTKISTNTKYTTPACSATGTLTYTYNSGS